MIIFQEKIAPPEPLPSEPPDVLSMRRTSKSLERENAWLRTQLDRLQRK
jgi:IS1 family transposase